MQTDSSESGAMPLHLQEQSLLMQLAEINQLVKLGELEQAKLLCTPLSSQYPQQAAVWHQLGKIAARQGDYMGAVSLYEKALSLDPAHALTHHDKGLAFLDLDRKEDALQCFQQAITLNPQFVAAYNNLGNLYQGMNQVERAIECFEKGIQLAPQQPELHFNLSLALNDLNRKEEAIACLRRVIALNPGFTQAWFNLGNALLDSSQVKEAVEAYKTVISLDSSLFEAYVNLGFALYHSGKPEEAISYLENACRMRPDSPEAHGNLGDVLHYLGEYDRAKACYQTILRLNPQEPAGHSGLAMVLEKQNRYEEALTQVEPFLNAADTPVGVALTYARTGPKFNRTRHCIEVLESVLSGQQEHLSQLNKLSLHFALGKLYDTTEDYDRAFAHYREGNALAPATYDPAHHTRFIDALINVFTRDSLAVLPRSQGPSSKRLIFIVGMLRSGTSLVEQIISSHPSVYGAGEQQFMTEMVLSLPQLMGVYAPYPQCAATLTQAKIDELATDYHSRISALNDDAPRVTLKNPYNFLHLGIINLLCPDAVVIHCKRNPVDTCFSCYTQFFSFDHGYSFNLDNLAHYYREYERIMAHWKTVVDLPMLEVPYEALVEDQEAWSRKIIEFCDLEWDDACLRFYENPRLVKTASYDQVRQPIYRSSVEHYRHYEKHLGSLLGLLPES